jgi:hypothetical protein
VISRFMVLGGLAMMFGRVLVVVRGILMAHESRDCPSFSPWLRPHWKMKHCRDR